MELKITKGEWTAFQSGDRFYIGSNGASFNNLLAEIFAPEEAKDEEDMANAQLIAEAGTVANETGKTPRQLADLNKELLQVLIELRDGDYPFINGGLFDYINQAIQKAQ